jgi:hypothetical protein
VTVPNALVATLGNEGDTIRIGEDTNVVVLKKAEWNAC